MARMARFVATGFFRTNFRFPVSIQQKYWDHGPIHRAVDHDAAYLLRAKLLRLGGKAEVGVDLTVGEQLHCLGRRDV